MTAITMAEVHSRSPVTAAGGISWNSLAAIPAPTCTETIPDTTIAAGRAADCAVRNTMKAQPGGARASCGPGFMLMVTRSGGGAVRHPSGWSLYPGCGLLPGPVSGQPGFYVRDQREGGVGKPAKLVAVAMARCHG